MCDTMVIEGGCGSVFGKNSDRDPGELQFLQYSTDGMSEITSNPCPEKMPRYIDGPYRNLKAHIDRWKNNYPAFLSRPARTSSAWPCTPASPPGKPSISSPA